MRSHHEETGPRIAGIGKWPRFSNSINNAPSHSTVPLVWARQTIKYIHREQLIRLESHASIAPCQRSFFSLQFNYYMKLLLSFAPLLLAVLTLFSAPANAQPGSGGPNPTGPAGPTAVPLDGGASLLLAGGLAYGLRHLRNRNKKSVVC